ncbi:MAG: deoxynucleoside kinase [Fusobacteriaceae bacterium]
MNIIFEGIDAVGKTTLLNSLKNHFDENGQKSRIIKEIEDSPLNEILSKMLKEDPFFNSKINFKTSIYESFLLAADFFYKQEYFRENREAMINIYDRDFFTLLCYQRLIVENEYGERAAEFFENFTKCIMFDIKNIDLFVYMSVPLETTFKRIQARDNYILNLQERGYLERAKERFENQLLPELKAQNINIVKINGEEEIEQKLKKILKGINYEKIEHIK